MAIIIRVGAHDAGRLVEIRERSILPNHTPKGLPSAVAASLVADLMDRYPDIEHFTVERLMGDEPCKT